ncbi:MAG: serine hydrolase, partial [Bacteroidetes bacterium]|nr:serine hydrolase [Bacteroidota bacterium]
GFYCFYKQQQSEKEVAVKAATDKIDHVSIRLLVDDRYKLIKPLAFVDFIKEDSLLLAIKSSIGSLIEEQKNEGSISSASVYLRNLNRHQEVGINPLEIYFPGSLMKIPILIAYLRQVEKDPGIFDKQLAFINVYGNLPTQNIKTKSIKQGNSYSVRELLVYMIEYSDNNATAVLSENIEFKEIQKIFSDLQLPIPDANQPEYGISLKEYSRLFRVLYNSTYLGRPMSEFALDLLSKCDFKDGLMKYLDTDLVVAHKFGERNSDGVQQLHEIGIVYLKNKAYLLGVMTKGNNISKQKETISQISKLVYDSMNSHPED